MSVGILKRCDRRRSVPARAGLGPRRIDAGEKLAPGRCILRRVEKSSVPDYCMIRETTTAFSTDES